MAEKTARAYKKISREKWGPEFELWKAMFRGFIDMMTDQSKKPGTDDLPLNPLAQLLLDYFIDVARARMNRKLIIMHSFNFTPEIFLTLNLEPIMQEMFSVSLASFHLNEHYIDISNEIGYGDNPTICNAQRPLIGSMKEKAAIIPDLLTFLSTPCNSLAISYQVFHHLTKVPAFNIDMPYWSYKEADQYYDEKTLDYVIKQLKMLIEWLEKQGGQKFDEENFVQVMTWSNQARNNALEFNELLRTVPCPARSADGFGNYLSLILRAGTEAAVKSTGFIRDNALKNVKKGIGGVPDEKLRIAWPYTHVFFDNRLLPWIEKKFNAVVIMDMFGHYQAPPLDISTPERCFESLAKSALDASMVGTVRGPVDFYIDYVIRFIKDYKIDCVIFPIHMACRQVYSIVKIASEEVRKATGIPSLIFGCDTYDSREVPGAEIRGKISDFITEIVS